MKKTILLVVILISGLTLHCQNFNLFFKNNDNEYLYLDTSQNNILLNFFTYHFFVKTKHIVYGKYKFKRKKMVIYPNFESLIDTFTESNYVFLNKRNDNYFTFKVYNKDTIPIPYVFISYNKSKNNSAWTLTDKHGAAKLYIDLMPCDSIININLTGYQYLKINISSTTGADFLCFLKSGQITKHREKIKFKYKYKNDSIFLQNSDYFIKLKNNPR